MTIKQMQHLLSYLGYYVGSVDGIWGTLSKTACEAFQKDFFQMESKADGVCGPETEKALTHSVAYGMPAKKVEKSEREDMTGTFWDEIEYFKREEMRCKCGGRYCNGFPAEPQQPLMELADRARQHFGRPAHVVSGLRCQRWNQIQGGVANSQHMYGEAMDIRIDGVSAAELLAWMKKQPEVRYCYAINSTNVHFDVPKGNR